MRSTTGTRAAEMALRLKYAGQPAPARRDGARARGRTGQRWVARASGTVYCSRRTRRCSTCATLLADRGVVRPYWEAGMTRPSDRPSVPRAPQHLRRPRQHRRVSRALRVARDRLRGASRAAPATRCPTADLYYLGGGQDRDQMLVAEDLQGRPTICARPSTTARRCWPCAAATSCWATATAGTTATRCPAPGWSISRPSPGDDRMIGNITLRVRPRARRAAHAGRV